MSSTDDKAFAALARRFFDERLMAAARKIAEDGRSFFPPAPDPASVSYYEQRAKTRMTRADFELPDLDAPEKLAEGLARFWRERGADELAALAPELSGLAVSVRSAEDTTEEVSPFIYVMF